MVKSITITSKFCIILKINECVLVDETASDIAVMIDATVAKERPPAPYVLAVLEVYIYHKAFFLVVTCPVIELALRTSHETAAQN